MATVISDPLCLQTHARQPVQFAATLHRVVVLDLSQAHVSRVQHDPVTSSCQQPATPSALCEGLSLKGCVRNPSAAIVRWSKAPPADICRVSEQ
jgi:hypothetical protein